MMQEMLLRVFRPPHPTDLGLTLAPLAMGNGDPTLAFAPAGIWRATRTPDGPATTLFSTNGADITVRAWGQGAQWALEYAPTLCGADDDDDGFIAHHAVIADGHRRHPGLRIAKSQAITEALVPSIIEQKVVGLAARRSWRALVRRYGEPAPGPVGKRLWLPPPPARLANLPAYVFHTLNLEFKRAETIRLVCSRAPQLEAAPKSMTALPGIGPWTYAKVALVALGDADAVPVGDFHLKNIVAWNLAGKPRGTDAEMLELLEPYRGQRGRAVRLLLLGGSTPPRYGPRLELQDIAAI